MSKRSRGIYARLSNAAAVPAEDREQFIRDNAVAMIHERDAKIAALRKEVTRLTHVVCALRKERRLRTWTPEPEQP